MTAAADSTMGTTYDILSQCDQIMIRKTLNTFNIIFHTKAYSDPH